MTRMVFILSQTIINRGRPFGHVLSIPSSAIRNKIIERKQSITRYGQD